MPEKNINRLICFSNLGKQFDYRWAVRKAQGEIIENDYLALLGPNGAGKSTLLHLLTRLYKAHEGEVSYPGFKNLRDFYSKMDLLSHHSMFYPRLSAFENIDFFNRLRFEKEAKESIDYALEFTGLQQAKRKKADGFSRGMLQRLTLARMILIKPEMVFLDEPFTGLDLSGQKMLIQILQKRGMPEISWKIKSFILVDHDFKRAHELSEQLWIVTKGSLAQKIEKKKISLKELEKKLS
ncbi:MAG: ABC transporter ATP-binding protein [Spirochaetia bacterium]|nr:ABC transporter ATP-binding protein [Spirochaetia bacterium]